MSASPTLRLGSTLVVFDGPRRLSWSTRGPAGYVPAALWPTPQQAAKVMDHLRSGGGLMVVVEQETTSIPVYAKEAARIPAELAARITVTSDGVLSELHVRALDWLPPALRERGLRFLKDSARLMADRPELLLPHLIVEEPAAEPGNLRFARRRAYRPYSDDRLSPVADHLFATAANAAVIPLPALEAAS